MRINVVQLENIRSHVKTTVPFTSGFNCLVGALGCGKSSILYSIDFAFFGEPVGRSFEYLLREGTDKGKITVEFTQNNKTCRIIRGLKRRGKGGGINQDFEELKLFEEDTLIASMKSDAVAEQFKSITGLDRDLWREIIWVRQEHLKELLDTAPRDRQKRLDELFGLSDYELAWSSIGEYQRDYEIERRVLERDPDVTGKEKLCAEYDRVTSEFTVLEVELLDAQEKLGSARRCMQEADMKLKRLEDKKLAVEELKREEARLLANIMNAEDSAASLTAMAKDERTVLENLQQRQTALDTQTASWREKLEKTGVKQNERTEMLRTILHELDDRISSLKAEQEATSRGILTDQKRADQLSNEKENRCPLCQQPLKTEYKIATLERIKQENIERQTSIMQLQREIAKVQQTKNIVNEAFSNLQTLASRLEDLKTRLNEEETNLADTLAQAREKQRQSVELRGQLDSLRFEIGRFDVSSLELAREQSKQTLRECLSVESDLKTKQNRKQDLLKRIDEVKERIDQAQQKLERMEKISKTIERISAIRDAYRGIQPKLRSEFVKILRNFVQQVLDGLVGEDALLNVTIDDTYSPYVMSENGAEREVSNLSGGERTLVAFAYRLGLGQLIMQSRTGHGLSMLLLDEPTESLGREDGSIDRLAEAISRFKAIEQIIAVTHSEAFAEKAEHVITLEKEAGVSRVSIER
ncbi:MAG TPA: SMC family ATPase [Candidatus Sulfotelmatobacter sp.]|nr:SMC family ATPase [Candidatus Sulfotelmatobacter sp.]